MKQFFENLPEEIRKSRRFFPVSENKVPLQKDWSNPNNQKNLSEINGLAGFDTCGHGLGIDYLFCDFDHVLNKDTGAFVNDKAAEFVNKLLLTFKNIYIEKSISGTGLHAFLVPTVGKFDAISNGKLGVLHFSDSKDKNAPKLELFYGSGGRYCLSTGNLYAKGNLIPSGVEVDDYLTNLQEEIKNQISDVKPARKEENIFNYSRAGFNYNDPQEYQQNLISEMLDAIDPAQLSDSDWLAVMSACKNLGVPYSVTDSFNRRDASRYNEQENQSRWDSLKDPSFGIETLIGKAQQFGFSVKDFKRQWYSNHPQFKDVELKQVQKQIAAFDVEKDKALKYLNNLKTFNTSTVLSSETLKAAAFAKLYDQPTFLKFKNNVKTNAPRGDVVNLPDFMSALKPFEKEIKTQKSNLSSEKNKIKAEIDSFSFISANDDLKELIIPENYCISADYGIRKVVGENFVDVCRRPIIINKRLFNVENSTYKVILAYQNSNGKWKKIPATGTEIIADKSKIVGLAANNLPITSVNAFQIVDFLDAFKIANENTIPLEYTVSRCGWHVFNNEEFFIDPRRDSVIEDDNRKIPFVVDSSSQFATSLKSAGSFEEWKKAYNLVKTSPVARIMVAASIAAPLLKVLGERNFLLHIFAPTRAGKTTALLLGASTFGNEKVIRSFDATKNGLIGAAADVNDYAFLIDEKQVADKYIQLSNLVYALANGIGRTKLNKDSTLKKLQDWRTIAIMTGETVLTDDNVTGGVHTRLLQIDAPKEILPPETCKEIRQIIKQNYGLVLPLFIKEILEYKREVLREWFQTIIDYLKEKNPELLDEYYRYLAVITMADYLLNQICCGDENVYKESINNTIKIFELIPTKTEIEDTTHEKDMVLGFIAQNQRYFAGALTIDPTTLPFFYGKIEDYIYITVNALKKACSESSFNYKKVVSDLTATGFFVPANGVEKDRKKQRANIQTTIVSVKTRCYRIPLTYFDSVKFAKIKNE